MGLFKKTDKSLKNGKGLLSKTKAWNLQRKAESGNIESQYQLGINYLEGKDVEMSIAEATRWLGASANNGYLQAQVKLGDMCFEGEYFDSQPEISFKWYALASNQGDVHSTYRCGMMLLEGKGCPISIEDGVKCIFAAANKGDLEAALTAALIYRDGVGVKSSPALAEKWFNVVTSKGKKCDQLITQMYIDLASKGDLDSIYRLTAIYENSQYGIDVSAETYYDWAKTIANTGDPDFCLKYGEYMINSSSENCAEALSYLNKAAEMGVGEAHYLLGKNHFENGDIKHGIEFMVEASEYGVDEADLYLGTYLYENKDYANAIEWLKIPGEKDMGDSILMRAVSFEQTGNLKSATYTYYRILNRLSDNKRLEVAINLDYEFNDYECAAIAYEPFAEINEKVFNRLIYIYENKVNDPHRLAELYEDSGEPIYLQKAAEIYENLNDKDSALSCYERFVVRDASDPNAMRVADLYYELGYNAEAIDWYTALVDSYNADKDMAVRIAQLYNEIGDYDNAAFWFESTNDTDYLMIAADIYRNEVDDPLRAAEIYEKNAPCTNDRLGHLILAAECYEEALRYKDAAVLYEQVAKNSWFWDADLLFKAAYIYRDHTIYDYEYVRIMTELANQQNTEAMIELGKLEEDRGDYHQAKRWYREAANLGCREAQDLYNELNQGEQW